MRRKLALCTSAAALALAAPSFAQTAANASGDNGSTTVQEVVVTGFRASLQSALNAKRVNELPMESVAPEDIGKMPDQNVAESLQRLPGVQIDRSQGQGTSVLIDGLRQNAITLNGDTFLTGKEFYVSGEASGGGLGSASQYDSLEGIPSEEIGRIDVYKNPNAAITEGGLGGTVDLRTRDPLDAPEGLTFGGNVRGTTSDGTRGATPNATLVATYKMSPALAFTGSVSYDDEKTLTKEFEAYNRSQWDYPYYTGGSTTAAPQPSDYVVSPKSYLQPQLAYLSNINDERKILGGTAGVSAKLTDSLKTSLNWFYSHEDDESFTYSDKVWFNGSGLTPNAGNTNTYGGLDPNSPYAIDGNGVVQSGTFYAPGAETATLYQHGITEANNVQWRTSYANGGPFKADLDLSYSRATQNYQAAQADIEHGLYNNFSGAPTSPGAPGCNNGSYTCAGAGNPEYQFVYSNGGSSGLPMVKYNSNVLSDASDTTFKSNWAWANRASQDKFAVRADASYELPYLAELGAKLSVGVRYEDRKVEESFGRYLLDTGGAANCCQDPNGDNHIYYLDPGYINIPYSNAATNPKLAMLVNNFGAGPMLVKNPYTGGMTNPATFLNTIWNGASINGAGTNNSEKLFIDPLSSFRVKDDTTAGYVMFDLGRPANHFHINLGVRFVQTDLTVNNAQPAPNATYYGTASWNGVDSNAIAVTSKRSYTDVLPTINAEFDVAEHQKVRFSMARVMSPQDLYSLGVGGNYGFTRATGDPRCSIHSPGCSHDGFVFDGGTSGNAKLDPYRATQGLISYENYFAPGALVSVEGFYKWIDNFVEIQNIPTTVADDFGTDTANVKQPVNAGKGDIYGFEFTGQYAFGDQFLPLLKGFGFAGNYTISQSTSDQATAFASHLTIPGVARNAFTLTGYYERYGFSGRLSYSWRDKAVSDGVAGATFPIPNAQGLSTIYGVFSAPYGQLDGQIGYDFNPHVGVVFSVQNITDEAQHTYLQWPNQPFTYDDWGRRYFFGVKFKG